MAIDNLMLFAFEGQAQAHEFMRILAPGDLLYKGVGLKGNFRDNVYESIETFTDSLVYPENRRYIVIASYTGTYGLGCTAMQFGGRLSYHTYSTLMSGPNRHSSDVSRLDSAQEALQVFEEFHKKTPEEMMSFIANADSSIVYYVKKGIDQACFATCLETPGGEYIVDIVGPHVVDGQDVRLPEPPRQQRSLLGGLFKHVLKK